MPASILNRIVAQKRTELTAARAAVPLAELRQRIAARPPALDFAAALRGPGISLIAEVKKASPSKGLLRADFDPAALAAAYAAHAAAAISVITDAHFQGAPEHLTAVKDSAAAGNAPVLRKDFIFDEYQVYEARAIGADAYLLIADILSPAQLADLIAAGQSLGMTPLVETHNAAEIAAALNAGAAVIGINNRNLHTFVTDLTTTETLAPLIPPDRIIVSESGISAPDDLARLAPSGVSAVLVGEALVTAANTAAKVRTLANAGANVSRMASVPRTANASRPAKAATNA